MGTALERVGRRNHQSGEQLNDQANKGGTALCRVHFDEYRFPPDAIRSAFVEAEIMSGATRRLEAEPVLPAGLLDKLRGQARDSILSERRQGESRQADEDQVRRFHAGAGCLITCLV